MINGIPSILIIDHEQNLCWVVQRILEREGYLCRIAKDGASALDLICASQPDIALVDLMLPDMSGQELCRRIRDISDCRIIYFSSVADLKLAGPIDKITNGFINKPASMKRIVHAVGNALK